MSCKYASTTHGMTELGVVQFLAFERHTPVTCRGLPCRVEVRHALSPARLGHSEASLLYTVGYRPDDGSSRLQSHSIGAWRGWAWSRDCESCPERGCRPMSTRTRA